MNDSKNEISKENINQNNWTPENTVSIVKCVVAGAAVIDAGICTYKLISDPVYDVIIDNDHGHFQALISANNQRSEEKVSS